MLTIKVYRVGSDGTTVPVAPAYKVQPATEPSATTAYPPCGCPRHRRREWCDFHKGPSQSAVPVDEHRLACAPCREQRSLAPRAEAGQR